MPPNAAPGRVSVEQDPAEWMRLEARPERLNAARYDRLPYPLLTPVQEIAFDVGITALREELELHGLVVRGFQGHQLIFEQRWPARALRQRTGESNLAIAPGTGLAVRSLHFLLPAYEPLSLVEVTALAKRVPGGQALQGALHIPVAFREQKTALHFPLEGLWWAVQAGDWSDMHKQEVFSQPYAVDFVALGADGRYQRDDGLSLEEHYSWDQPVYAPAGGKVAYVCYDMPDLPPGSVADPRIYRDDPRRTLGNAVAISHGNGEVSFLGCLRQASIQVNEGELIRRGRRIGFIGNSGFSPGPHLHYHLAEGPNPFIDQGLPVLFSHFEAGGQWFDEPTTIPTRMIVLGPSRPAQEAEADA